MYMSQVFSMTYEMSIKDLWHKYNDGKCTNMDQDYTPEIGQISYSTDD